MPARYRHSGLVLVRCATDPDDVELPLNLDVSDPDAVRADGWTWLAQTWASNLTREALSAASPDLAARIEQLLSRQDKTADPAALRRVLLSTASYLARWHRRVTPFGFFAGIIPATAGPAAATINSGHHAVARSDSDWIAVLAARLEQDQDLRSRLTVAADNTASVRDGRLVRADRAAPGSRSPGPVREVSVRWTRPVRAASEIAASPISFDGLAAELAQRFPAATLDKVRAVANELVNAGFLITSLRPPMTAEDPLTWLISALDTAGAWQLPSAGPVLAELKRISGDLRQHNACADLAQAASHRAAITARMKALEPAGRHPLAIDLRLDGRVCLPDRVLDEAAAAADVLLRLTTRPFGSMAWLEYHARFLERYGPGALVPVRDLVSDSGLGYPDGYTGSQRARPAWRTLTERDAVLLRLIQQTCFDGTDEIVLTKELLQALIIDDHTALVPPQRIELGVTLHATSLAAINAGQFELHVIAAPRTATSMAGRFAHVLTDPERERLSAVYQVGTEDDTLTVQLSFPPRAPHNENVVRVAPLAGSVLPLGEHPAGSGAEVMIVEDLAVTADAAQLYLTHQPTGRRVIPQIPHALEVTVQTPPLARFIAEVADARTASFGPFDPGAARALTYVPRIRYRHTVLAAARWILTSTDLEPARDTRAWDSQLATWRQRWRVPTRIVLRESELRLPLNLDYALDRALLHTRLGKSGRIELQEDSPSGGYGWIGRPAELLIPLTLATPQQRKLPVITRPGRVHRPGGSAVVRAQFTGNHDRFDDILHIHLPAFFGSAPGPAERWWVRRYRDLIRPGSPQHLEIYLRLSSPDGFACAATEFSALAERLDGLGLPAQLTFASCYEQPGRYGTGGALTAAERVFAADTAAAIAQITLATNTKVTSQALTAASMAQLASAFAADAASGYGALAACLRREHAPVDRAARDLACQLADPAANFAALRALPGGDTVAHAWAWRDDALTEYHQVLAAQRDPGTTLVTLLHEHHMRAVGLDPEAENQTGGGQSAGRVCPWRAVHVQCVAGSWPPSGPAAADPGQVRLVSPVMRWPAAGRSRRFSASGAPASSWAAPSRSRRSPLTPCCLLPPGGGPPR
jgi:lantibiotic biosynthesis protein